MQKNSKSFQDCLSAHDVHLWLANLDIQVFPPERYWSTLSEDEQQRAQRFVTSELSKRFIIARGLLRYLLSLYTQQPPADLVFSYSEKGKPSLAKPLKDGGIFCFNMSHTDKQALYAIARQAVGVDIEQIRETLKHEELTRLVLSDAEKQAWHAVPIAQRRLAFFRTWTRKEALLKASGKGLAGNMRQLCLPLSPRMLALHNYFMPIEPRPWTLYDLPQQNQTVGCVVTQQPVNKIILRPLCVRSEDFNPHDEGLSPLTIN